MGKPSFWKPADDLKLYITLLLSGRGLAVGTVVLYMLQLHTSELQDGYDWGRLNLTSVTEQNSLDEFLTTAELAGTEFTAGKYADLQRFAWLMVLFFT